MKVGYLQSIASPEDLQAELTAFENAGCERIVVDNGAHAKQGDMLKAVLSRLKPGDTLVVWSLSSVAGSMPELVDLALELEARKVRLRSLTEGFDTNGENERASLATLRQLHAFQQKLSTRREVVSRRRPGRPRVLNERDIERARTLLSNGTTVDEAARQLNISRATLYRYLQP